MPKQYSQPDPDNLLAALDLMELGIELQRQRLIQANPSASSEFIALNEIPGQGGGDR